MSKHREKPELCCHLIARPLVVRNSPWLGACLDWETGERLFWALLHKAAAYKGSLELRRPWEWRAPGDKMTPRLTF